MRGIIHDEISQFLCLLRRTNSVVTNHYDGFYKNI